MPKSVLGLCQTSVMQLFCEKSLAKNRSRFAQKTPL